MSASAQLDKRAVSWAWDVGVVVVGLTAGVLGLLSLLRSEHLDVHWLTALLVGAPLAAVMSRFPLVLAGRKESGIEVGFESAVLVFFACFDGGEGALAVWAVSQVLAHSTADKRVDIRAFNMGLGILSGAAALLVMRAISDLDRTSPRELVAVFAGCAVFFAVDYVASAVSIGLEERASVRDTLHQGGGLAALGVFLAFDSLGYLAALVVRELPTWTFGLLLVPLVTIMVATRALSRGAEHRRRLAALFDTAAEAQVVHSREALEELLDRNVREALGNPRAGRRAEPPGDREIGAAVRTGDSVHWLVAPAVHRARATVEADRQALEALATVGEEAFARLSLTDDLAHLARHDSLTSLPNRTLFLDRVEVAVQRSRRSGAALAVLFLDLDGFKAVNDRFGHAEGDALLNTVAGRLLACVRTSDSVARLGGDEFAVLVEGVEHDSELDQMCRRLLHSLRREIAVAGHDLVVGASIGVAIADPADEAAGLLRNADMAMYRAKAEGKDRYVVYQPSLREENLRRLELVEALRRGVRDELVVHYQPVVDLVTGRVDGLEALVRWERDGRLVPPQDFIPAAEESGLIVELGEWVLAQVVRDAPALTAAVGRSLTLGVNMSAHQLRDPSFLGTVAAAVSGLGASRLVLEMTETVVVSDDQETAEALDALKALGVVLAIDDFGVGFSSIGYLQQLPVDIVKIDRSFTRDIDSSPRAATLVEAIVVMAAALDLRVVAEGVEREAQVERLLAMGCTIGQGFHFGRPAPLGEVLAMLRGDQGGDLPSGRLGTHDGAVLT